MASRRDKRKKEGWLSALFGGSREEARRPRPASSQRSAPQPERDPIEERRRMLRESGASAGGRRPFSFGINPDTFRSGSGAGSPGGQQGRVRGQQGSGHSAGPQRVQAAGSQRAQAARQQQSRPQQRSASHEVLPEPYRSYYAKVPKKPYYPVAVPKPKPEPPKPRPLTYDAAEIYGVPRAQSSPVLLSAPWERAAQKAPAEAAPAGEAPRQETEPAAPAENVSIPVQEPQAAAPSPAAQTPEPAPVREVFPAAPAAGVAPALRLTVPPPQEETLSIWDRLALAAAANKAQSDVPPSPPVTQVAGAGPSPRERLIALVSGNRPGEKEENAPAPVPAAVEEECAPAPVPAAEEEESAPAPVPAAEEEESIWDRLLRAAPPPSDRPAPLVRLPAEELPDVPDAPNTPERPAPAEPQPAPAEENGTAAEALPQAEPSAPEAPADDEQEQAQAIAALLSQAEQNGVPTETAAAASAPAPEETADASGEAAPLAAFLPAGEAVPLLPPPGPGRYVYVDNCDDWDEDPFFTSWDMEQFPEEDFPEEQEEAEELPQAEDAQSAPAEAAEAEEAGAAAQAGAETGSLPAAESAPPWAMPSAEKENGPAESAEEAAPVSAAESAPPWEAPAAMETEPGGQTVLTAAAAPQAVSPQSAATQPAQPVRPAPRQPTAILPALPTSLLVYSPEPDMDSVEEELNANGEKLIETLQSFGVRATMLEACRGPAVTRYELQPAAGVKISKITNLSDDIAMNLAALGVRIEAPIPGKAAVGIEVPNRRVSVVRMRELIESPAFRRAESPLTTVLGRDIAGELVLADLGKMPHLLIAGSTGSGKSVCINSLIVSLLYKSTPQDVRFLMIDPKVVELGVYNGIPHLIVPVVTDPRKAAGALGWAVTEMLRRYQQFAANNVRDLGSYNRLAAERGYIDEQGMRMEHMPQIVIIIDELADLMMAAPNEVEDSICRLAQMARAAGMHLVIATQRPSVDVITGIIKANIPSRIAFAVSSQVDSRTILDVGGAEKLLGRGDMLFSPLGVQKPMRVQGCFIDDREIEAVVEFIRKAASAEYDEGVMEEIERGGAQEQAEPAEEPGSDPMIPEAVRCVVEAGQASTSLLQRRLRLGYARAGRLIDEMEQMGVVGPHEGSKARQVLISWQQYLEMAQSRGWEN